MSPATDPSLAQDHALQLLEALPGATLVLDPATGSVLFASQAVEDLLGLGPSQLIGQPIAALDTEMAFDGDWGKAVERLREKGTGRLLRRFKVDGGRELRVEVRARYVELGERAVVLASLHEAPEGAALRHDLGERVKELGLLHHVASLVHEADAGPEAVFASVLEAIPPAWQYPGITEARITHGDVAVATPGFRETDWQLKAPIRTSDGTTGELTICYTEPRPKEDDGVFLTEEVALIRSTAAMLQVHLEERVRASRSKSYAHHLEAILESAPLILFDLDHEGRLTFQTGQGLSGIGRTDGESVGQRIQDLYPDHEDIAAGLAAVQEGRPVDVTLPLRGRWLRIQAKPRFDEDGRPDGATGVALDVTEREEARRTLEELTETIEDVFWVRRLPSAELVYASKSLEHFALSAEAVKDRQDFLSRVHPKDRDAVDAYQRALYAGVVDEDTVRFRIEGDDGVWRWAEAKGYLVRDEAGQPERAMGVTRDVTAEEEATRAMERTQQRFELATQAVTDVIWEWDASTDRFWWSESLEDALGVPPEAIPDTAAMDDRVHPDDLEDVRSAISAFLGSDEEIREIQHRIRRGDGSYAHVINRGIAVRDGDGRVTRVVGGLQDRTQEVETQRQLEFQASLLDQIGEAVIATDLEGTISYWNQAAESTYGYTAEEVIGRNIAEVTVPETTAAQAAEIMEALRAGETWTGEFVVQAKDGREFPALVTDTPLQDPDGRLIGIIGTSTDISGQKALEQALRDSEARQRGWLQAAPDMLGTIDPADNRITWINETFEELTGWKVAEWVGRTFEGLVHPEDLGDITENYLAALDGQEPSATEVRVETADGAYRWFSVLGRPVRQGDRVVDYFVVARDISDLKEAQAALVESEATKAAVLTAIPDMVFVLDANGTYLDVYPSVEADPYVPADEILGQRIQAIFEPEIAAAMMGSIARALETGSAAVEYELEEEGGAHTYEARVVALGDDRVAAVVRDVTEAREAEAGLARRAQQQATVAELGRLAIEGGSQALLAAAPEAVAEALSVPFVEILFLEEDGTQLALRAGTGWEPGIVGTTTIAADQGSQADYTLQADEPVVTEDIETEDRFRAPYLLTAHGVRSGMTVVLRSPDGPMGVLGAHDTQPRAFSADDTHFLDAVSHLLSEAIEREGQRQDLEESQGMFQLLAESVQDIFWMVDPRTEELLYISPRHFEIWGHEAEDLNEHPELWFEYVHPDDRQRVIERFTAPDPRDRAGRIDYRVLMPDGSQAWAESRVTVVAGPDGEVDRVIGLSRDITELKEAQEHREEALMRQAEAEHYQRVAEFKTQFLNTAAHELSTPLTPMRFQVEALRSGMMGELSDKQADAVNILDRSIQRFSRLTRDLLDAARLQAGRLSLERQDIDLSALVTEVAGSFEEMTVEDSIEFTVDPDGPLRCHADGDRLGQVLTNLIDNAIKFTPAGGRIDVRARPTEHGCEVRVTDTGIGMDPEQMSKLFEPFSQVHAADATERRGSGLGLYISKGIAEQHGGSLEVASAGPGQGTTFTLHLPDAEDAPERRQDP